MSSEIIDSLGIIAKGAFVYLVGSVLGMLLAMLTKILIIRSLTPAQFGVFTLALTIVTIASKIGSFGLPSGATRQASYFLGKGDKDGAEAVVIAGVLFSILFGFVIFLVLYIFSNWISIFFKISELSYVLKILSISTMFMIITSFVSIIFSIYHITKVKVFLSDITPNVIRFLLITLLIYITGINLYNIAWIYTIPYLISGILALIIIFKNIKLKKIHINLIKEYGFTLLSFSIPLLLQSIISLIMNWTDVVLIGYFLTAKDVGLYSSASVLARFIMNILVAVNFLYLPVISSFYASSKIYEIRKIYAVITKWIMTATLPYFLILFLFPNTVLWLLYGKSYVSAKYVLRFLVLAFFIHVIFGPNGITLISLGDSRFVMYTTLIGAIINFILNIILIPLYNINGAAIVTAATYTTINIILVLKLYSKYKITPFNKNYLKILVISVITILIFWIFIKIYIKKISLILLIISCIFYILFYISTIIISKSIDYEDIYFLRKIKFKILK